MLKKATLIVGLAIVVVTIAVAVFLHVHIVREAGAGTVLWNSNEAYLFLNVARRGIHPSYMEYPWLLLKEFLHGVRAPDDQKESLVVIRVTQSATERHDVLMSDDGLAPVFYTPIEGGVYANCPDLGGLCKWSNNHFERASKTQEEQFHGINGLRARDFDDIDNWSKRGIGSGRGNTLATSAINVGGLFTVLEKSEPVDNTGYAAVSIEVNRPGASPERIWYLDGHPRKVTRNEYEKLFQRR